MHELLRHCPACERVADFWHMHEDDDVPGHFDGSEIQCGSCFTIFTVTDEPYPRLIDA
jgi:hypothetical protein